MLSLLKHLYRFVEWPTLRPADAAFRRRPVCPAWPLLLPAGPAPLAIADAPGPAVQPGPTLAEQAALRRRLRDCRHHLRALEYAEEGRPALAATLARRTQVLTTLRAALALEDAAAPPSREVAWLELVELATARVARRQPTPTAQQWRALRLRLLRDEEAGLLALLAT